LLGNGVMRWLGDRSYGIYLIHLALMNRVLAWTGHGSGLGATFWLTLPITTSIALVRADLSWRLVERPALQRRLPWRRAEFGAAAPGSRTARRRCRSLRAGRSAAPRRRRDRPQHVCRFVRYFVARQKRISDTIAWLARDLTPRAQAPSPSRAQASPTHALLVIMQQ
jgi:hypothetical protein